ncbi:predicted protein [Naegleria gruberi]|uniref:Protein YIPF n=1 Tax=Naegleria gruberi TaxID=5762 RepID=D2W1Z3_NAEGR|nr:uncharacterized protein NAEGRDRAFT_75400 [Naegleria gruberi]EFC36851.1 predicted protein [Naegleria gruberi]|eukprot:XP_002669595.1 predicted protein [Naegleria gruberi strain NEG-M]
MHQERNSVLWNNSNDPFYNGSGSNDMLSPSSAAGVSSEYTFQPIRHDDFFGGRGHSRNPSFDMVDVNYNSGGSASNSRPTSPIGIRSTSPLVANQQQMRKQNSLEPVIDEVPLLEELGINFTDMWDRSLFVLNPFSRERRKALHSMMITNDPHYQNQQQQQHHRNSSMSSEESTIQHLLKDMDLAGPLIFCLALGFTLLLKGKIHFNYIYGVVVIGCLSIYVLLNLMCPLSKHIELQHCISILGYGLLPMVVLGLLTTLLPFPYVSLVLSAIAVFWSTYGSSTMFVAALGMSHQRMLVSYPIGLVYATFALITVL